LSTDLLQAVLLFYLPTKQRRGTYVAREGLLEEENDIFPFFSLSLCDETKTYKIICRASTLKIVCHLLFSPYQRAPPRPETVCRQIVYSRLLISAVVRSRWPLSTAMRTTLCVRSAYDDVARPLDAFRSRAYAELVDTPRVAAEICCVFMNGTRVVKKMNSM
jgi:hypothetical protein